MRKYFFGIIAVVLAIGFSSFKNEKKNNRTDDVYYFYIVDSNGNIPSGSSVQFGGAVTLSYADTNDGCSGTTKDCLRGFLTQPTLPTSASGDAQTRKN